MGYRVGRAKAGRGAIPWRLLAELESLAELGVVISVTRTSVMNREPINPEYYCF